MVIKKIITESDRRLILIMAGWGMDDTPFRSLRRPGYDIAVAWDYRSPEADWSVADGYDEICLFAWSLGVASAARFIPGRVLAKITRRVAVNGTVTPVSDTEGIPEAIFRGTLYGLDERNLMKFRRRMCGGREAYDNFCRNLPERTLADLRQELAVFLGEQFREPVPFGWDAAVIGLRDAIFPPENQRRAWSGVQTFESDAPHLPDFQDILDRFAIDKETMSERFGRDRGEYDRNAEAQSRIVDEICKCIDNNRLTGFGRVLEIGSGSGLLSRRLVRLYRDVEMWDITGDAPVEEGRFRRCDAETELCLTPASSFDAIFSASTVQWFNSPLRFLRECERVLAPGGTLVFSTFLPDNLSEVAAASGRSLLLPGIDDWRGMIKNHFEERGVTVKDYTLTFDRPVDVFRHLKATGVNSLSRDGGNIFRALKNYPQTGDGKCRLTYRAVIFHLKKL